MSMQFASATDWQPRTPRASSASRSRPDDSIQRDRGSRRRELLRVVNGEHQRAMRLARHGWNDDDSQD
jgi:hypothetical protein